MNIDFDRHVTVHRHLNFSGSLSIDDDDHDDKSYESLEIELNFALPTSFGFYKVYQLSRHTNKINMYSPRCSRAPSNLKFHVFVRTGTAKNRTKTECRRVFVLVTLNLFRSVLVRCVSSSILISIDTRLETT